MPKGQYSRPFNKDLKRLSKSVMNAKIGTMKSIVGQASEAMEDRRKTGARLVDSPRMTQRERSRFNEKKAVYETGPENPPKKKAGPFEY